MLKRMMGIGLMMIAAVAAFADLGACADVIDTMIPKDCVMFVRVKSPQAFGEQFKQTAVWRTLAASEMADAGLDMLKSGARFFCALGSGKTLEEATDVLLHDACLVVFDVGDDPKQKPPMALICQVDPAKAKALIERATLPRLRTFDPRITVSKQEHAGVTITKIQAPHKSPLFYALTEQTLIVGQISAVQKVLDAAKQPTQSLGSDPAWRSAMQRVDVKAGGICYINTKVLVDKVRPLLAARPKQREGLVMTGVLGMKAVAVSAEVAGEAVRSRFCVVTGEDKIGLLRLATDAAAEQFAAPNAVPADHHIIAAAKMANGAALQAAFKAMLIDITGPQKVDEIAQFAAMLEQQMGISWQADFIDNLGGELFVALRLPNFAQLAVERRGPKPEDFDLIVGLSVLDKASIGATLDRLFQSEFAFNAGFGHTNQKYKGRDLFLISLPKNQAITPCYTFEAGFMLFVLAPQTLERVIDRIEDKRLLAASEGYKQRAEQLAKLGNVMAYVDLHEIFDLLMQLADAKAPPQFKTFRPEIDKLGAALSPLAIAIKGDADGISGQSIGPVGAPFALAALAGLGNLTKSDVGRRVQAAKERMKKLRNKLNQFYAQNQTYPQTLAAFNGQIEENVLLDPFLDGQQFRYAKSDLPNDKGWVLVSVGPDGKLDIDLATFKPTEWKAKAKSQDPAVVAELKGLLYQFNPKRNPDEKALDDEGDIVLVGP